MNIHVALYHWKPSASDEAIRQALLGIEGLVNSVPGLVEIVATKNKSKYSEGYTHVIFVVGENQAAIDAYRNHPEHLRLAQNIDDMEESGIGADFVTHDNPKGNLGRLREIDRKIASAVIISKDGKILMGRKDPAKGGVYPSVWHIPGGGIEKGETVDTAVIREISQEVVGLDLSKYKRILLPFKGRGSSPKTLSGGETVWANMEFNRVEVHLNKVASELERELSPGDDLVELHWFSRSELKNVEQIPGGREFFVEAGYLDN